MGFSNSQLVGKPFPASSHWHTVSVAGSTQSFYLSPGYPGGFSAFFLPWSLFPVENVQLSDISIWLSIHIEQKLHGGCTTFVPCPFDPAYGCILICRCCSVVSDSLWPHGLQAHQASLSFTISQSLLKLMPIDWVMPSNHLILCRLLLLLPLVFTSTRVSSMSRLFSLHQVAKVLELQHQTQSFQWAYSGLISFRIDWFDFLAGWRMDWSNLSHGLVKIKMILFMLQKHNFQEMLTQKA